MRLFAVLTLLSLLLSGCGTPDKPSIPLFLALQRGDIDQIERHIHWGSDIQAQLPNGQRPLQLAAATGNVVVVRLLLKNGAEVDAPSDDGTTALQAAILAGRTQAADVLRKQGATLKGDQWLLQAAAAGNPDRDVVDYLVEHGADTEARNEQGDTPLLLAVRGGHLRLARHLVERGADVNARDAQQRSALSLARQLGHTELAALLQRYGGQ